MATKSAMKPISGSTAARLADSRLRARNALAAFTTHYLKHQPRYQRLMMIGFTLYVVQNVRLCSVLSFVLSCV